MEDLGWRVRGISSREPTPPGMRVTSRATGTWARRRSRWTGSTTRIAFSDAGVSNSYGTYLDAVSVVARDRDRDEEGGDD